MPSRTNTPGASARCSQVPWQSNRCWLTPKVPFDVGRTSECGQAGGCAPSWSSMTCSGRSRAVILPSRTSARCRLPQAVSWTKRRHSASGLPPGPRDGGSLNQVGTADASNLRPVEPVSTITSSTVLHRSVPGSHTVTLTTMRLKPPCGVRTTRGKTLIWSDANEDSDIATSIITALAAPSSRRLNSLPERFIVDVSNSVELSLTKGTR